MTAEQIRLDEARQQKASWKKWGPYLSERQWGTVREDYSENGDAWNFFTHDHSRSRAYRWGEDGIAGISDDHQHLCFSLALWNGKDPILKERLFGLTNSEGNHGEDVKESYFYLDSTPTHSSHEVPLQVPARGVSLRRPGGDESAAGPSRHGVTSSSTLACSGTTVISTCSWSTRERPRRHPRTHLGSQPGTGRGRPASPADAVVPQRLVALDCRVEPSSEKPHIKQTEARAGATAVSAAHPLLGAFIVSCEGDVPLLFTENETNHARLFRTQNESPYVKTASTSARYTAGRTRSIPSNRAPRSRRITRSRSVLVRRA